MTRSAAAQSRPAASHVLRYKAAMIHLACPSQALSASLACGLAEGGACLAQVSAGNYDDKKYCSGLKTSSLTPVQKQGNYAQFSIPISSFQCPFPATQITQIGFQNSDGQLVSFCLDQIVIVGGGNGSGQVQSTSVQSGRHLKSFA